MTNVILKTLSSFSEYYRLRDKQEVETFEHTHVHVLLYIAMHRFSKLFHNFFLVFFYVELLDVAIEQY